MTKGKKRSSRQRMQNRRTFVHQGKTFEPDLLTEAPNALAAMVARMFRKKGHV